MPQFSVVIPTYNRAALLGEAIESVLAQDLSGLADSSCEIIVVDDGSTDDTTARLRPFGSRIQVIHSADNAGPAHARNLGLQQAQGEWVGFLDSDDRWRCDLLACVAREIERTPEAGLIAFAAVEIDSAGRVGSRVYAKKSKGPYYTTRSLLWGDSGSCSWFFAKRDLLHNTGGFDAQLRSAEECDLCLRLSFRTTLLGLREPLLLRRKHEGNLSSDAELNARSWIQTLHKLKREQPDFVRDEPWAYRRALAKERLRLGRELLVQAGESREALAEARQQLTRSVGTFPFFLRGWSYLGWALVAPTAYRRWRRRELEFRERRAR